MPLPGLDQQQLYKLNVPADLPVAHVFAGLRQGRVAPSQALWFAVMGLERSRPVLAAPSRAPEPSRGPTGY